MLWIITLDHGYEGEQQRSFEGTEQEAQKKAAELAAADPYIMRTWLELYPGQAI